MIDQITVANLLAASHGLPIHRRTRSEDDFYEEFGNSLVAGFAAWLARIGSKRKEDRASPARSSNITSSCEPNQAACLIRP
ncbi:hypothetical protein HGP14_03495 [Rhizobium sp. P32RR-XVIII]|uniref:hypothetical protein n=1 Tax=Rhizobium sp. P32RR-XVIII TaxID=2726738 RepID=UPI001456332B|nr:hypothetical protein [Rhizobium sp. P32RR-XVIII]NLS02437.1 hypothetical protein [Rhizobium sp. P32RR-XVIII]